MRHKIHNTFSTFEPKRPYSAVTRFSQKQRQKQSKQQHQVVTLKIHAWLGRVEIAVKQNKR